MKKILPLILSTLLLTSCSGPNSSGGVEFSKTDNSYPYGDCRGSGYQTHSTEEAGCGWVTVDENNYFIMTGAYLSNAYLNDANLTNANLSYANLSGAYLSAYLSNANLSYANLSYANLSYANLSNANLSNANLSNADLYDADLSGVKANTDTICPNGIHWGTSGNNCGF
ncbi:pentapeptide repeat-containing protein [Gammaproteobacteria bacterium]|nr:pentapeptide repeat-containing protein [Gammaproteobacteria bacterium]